MPQRLHRRGDSRIARRPGNDTHPGRLNGTRHRQPCVGAGLTPRALAPPTAHSSQGVAGAAPPFSRQSPGPGAEQSPAPTDLGGRRYRIAILNPSAERTLFLFSFLSSRKKPLFAPILAQAGAFYALIIQWSRRRIPWRRFLSWRPCETGSSGPSRRSP